MLFFFDYLSCLLLCICFHLICFQPPVNLSRQILNGKSAIYITNQTDGITNTSPILGSFTSLFIGPQLSANANTISSDYTTYQTGIQNDTLTLAQYGIIENDLNTASILMTTRQSADVTFYTNLKNMVNNYNTVKQFSNMGETQTYLIQNFIGTPTANNMIS